MFLAHQRNADRKPRLRQRPACNAKACQQEHRQIDKREGKKVLLIDADPQGSLTASLGYEEPDDLRITLATIMMDVINEEEISLEDGILHHQENVDLLPANIELSALEVTMGNVMSREMIMKEYIDAIRCRYDYILIDCMPSLGMLKSMIN